jgi:hypothetical protein
MIRGCGNCRCSALVEEQLPVVFRVLVRQPRPQSQAVDGRSVTSFAPATTASFGGTCAGKRE